MVKEDKLLDEIYEIVKSKRNIPLDDKSPIEAYTNHKHSLKNLKDFTILLLNAPCNGFGDVVFGMKLKQILEEWYSAKVIIASPKVDNFKQLGANEKDLIKLAGGKSDQCRRFRNLHFVDSNGNKIDAPEADLVFVGPLQMDFYPDYSDVKKLVPYSNYLNTYFFSEYNDDPKKRFDFPTGIGKDRMGMLFLKGGKNTRLPTLKNKYVVVYIAETVPRADTCFKEFVGMVAKKYYKKGVKKFDVVVPPWIGKDLIDNKDNLTKKVLKVVTKYYDNVEVKTKDMEVNLYESLPDNRNTLTIRADVLPQPYNTMRSVFTYAEKDILVTGDQSITDVMACCWKNKLPMYQIVPWKKDFSKELSENMPQKFLKHVSTSCGNTKAINYNPEFDEFMRRWDFKKLAKRKMDAIIAFTLDTYNKEKINEVKNIFLKSKSKDSMLKKLEKL